MTKEEFIQRWKNANSDVSVSAKVWGQLYNSVFETVHEVVHEGKEIRVREIGTFKLKHTEETKRRNPKTGEAVISPANS